MSWISLIVIFILAGLAVLGATRLRQRLRQETVRLEIANEGNIPSRYRLRAEHPGRLLTFRCRGHGLRIARDDSPLPKELILADAPHPVEPTPQAAVRSSDLSSRIGQALSRARGLSSSPTSLATMLPRPLKEPLMRLSSQLQGAQLRASYAQRQPQLLARHVQRHAPSLAAHGPGAIPSRSNPIPAEQLLNPGRLARRVWVETPALGPGEKVKLHLQVFSSDWHKDQYYTFRVLSHAVEAPDSPWVVTQVPVEIRGGFWARHYAPLLLILAVAIVALILV